MSVLKIENFSAMLPSRANTILPENAAAYAQNCWLFHGDIRGFRKPEEIYDLTTPRTTQSVYRVPDPNRPAHEIEGSLWLEFDDPDMCVFRAPVVNDQYQRFYFISPTESPQYNTYDRLRLGEPNFLLGIPAPVNAPTVAITGTDTTAPVTRAYVYTYVSAYGEEGSPSPALVQSGSEKNTWTLTIPQPAAAVTGSRNITKINIYRTIADGAGSATYFLAGSVPLGTTTFVDSKKDTEISGARQLPSSNWNPPPDDLVGATVMPNGIVAAWTPKAEIWFCEPYRPHTWPSIYTISVPFDIVGFGRAAQNLVVCTEGNPYIVTGVHPSTMAMSAVAAKEPCLSRHSIVSTEQGVYYASRNGLQLIQFGYAQAQNVTGQLFSRQRWAEQHPELFMGARMNGAYLAFIRRGVLIGGRTYDGAILPGSHGVPEDDGIFLDGSYLPGSGGANPDDGIYVDGIHSQFLPDADQKDNGCVIGGLMPNTTFTRVKFPYLVNSVYQDEFSGEIFVVANNKIWWWDKPEGIVFDPYIWQSKQFQFPAKQSFMAAKVFYDLPDAIVEPKGIGVPVTHQLASSQDINFDPTKQVLLLRVRADGRHVFTREITYSGELVLLPSGFKADIWQFEVEGLAVVSNIQVANSVKELAGA